MADVVFYGFGQSSGFDNKSTSVTYDPGYSNAAAEVVQEGFMFDPVPPSPLTVNLVVPGGVVVPSAFNVETNGPADPPYPGGQLTSQAISFETNGPPPPSDPGGEVETPLIFVSPEGPTPVADLPDVVFGIDLPMPPLSISPDSPTPEVFVGPPSWPGLSTFIIYLADGALNDLINNFPTKFSNGPVPPMAENDVIIRGMRVEFIPTTLLNPVFKNPDGTGKSFDIPGPIVVNSGSSAAIAAVLDGIVTITGLSGMAPGDVGNLISFADAGIPTNNGTYTITSYVSPTSVKITNSLGFAPDPNDGNILWSVADEFIIGGHMGNIIPGLSGTGPSINAVVGDLVTVGGLSGILPEVVGQSLVLSGAATAANNGTFVIAEVVDPATVKIVNGLGIAPDANNGALTFFWSITIVKDFIYVDPTLPAIPGPNDIFRITGQQLTRETPVLEIILG